MKYYVLIIEQIKDKDDPSKINEYANVKKYNDEQSALVYFYSRCSEIANALGETHYYGHIKVVNSLGGVIKQDTIGKYANE